MIKINYGPDLEEIGREELPDFEDDLELEYLTDHIRDDFERVFGEDEFEGELDFEDKR